MARDRRPDPIRLRRRLLIGVWLLSAVAVLARAAQVQILQGREWREVALGQQRTAQSIPAPRGRILDREGVPLAETRELYTVGVAPREVPAAKREELRGLLVEVLGISAREARSAVDPARNWVYLGSHPPVAYARLSGVRGVYLERELRRDYPQGRMALGILGTVQGTDGVGGVEAAFDDVLRGVPGRSVVAKDPSGRARTGQVFQMETPRMGGELTLTLDADLQAIAKEALAAAVDSTEATGGDLLVTDPHTGEILAAVSLKGGADAGLGFIGEPVEPGSTVKPFTLAGLLSRGRASLADEIDVGDGRWTQCGRTLHDTGSRGVITLERAVQVSSNVAMAKAAEALTPMEQWEGLRDFGFGEPTGIPIAGESSGTLSRPDQWTCQSRASHAIGYELSVTPLQIAMAYGALANGGRLMEPRIVKSIRHADGRRTEVEPRVVRRVVRRSVAEAITDVLVGVVDEGTGHSARLASYTVAGKSGTARAFVNGSYERGRYFSSFVGYFPAQAPQLVIYAKLDEVEGYGGALAGPVTRATMEAALAARGTPIQLGQLSRLHRTAAREGEAGRPVVHLASLTEEVAVAPTDPFRVAAAWAPDRPAIEVQVPDLTGIPTREAARVAHALGLRVRVEGSGTIRTTRPRPGALAMAGDTILLRSGRADR